MADDKLIATLIESVNNLNDKFSEFMSAEAARLEREKVDRKDIEALKQFKDEYKPVVQRSKKYQNWYDSTVLKAITLIIVALLITSGVVYIPKKFQPQPVSPITIEKGE